MKKISPLKGKPVPRVAMYYDAVVTDKNGRVTRRKKGICHSFVKQFIQVLRGYLGNAYETIKDYTNTDRPSGYVAAASAKNGFRINAGSANAAYGLKVGTGTNAVNIADYALQTPVAHGTGSGQLQHGAHSFGAAYSDATASYITISRVFTNASGATITINEIGIYSYGEVYAAAYVCLVRDKLAVGVSVPNGQSLTLTYTIKITV